jgi:hypothetical protein
MLLLDVSIGVSLRKINYIDFSIVVGTQKRLVVPENCHANQLHLVKMGTREFLYAIYAKMSINILFNGSIPKYLDICA